MEFPAISLPLLLLNLAQYSETENGPGVLVETSYGALRGFIRHFGEHSAMTFFAVPFAQTPVGDLRFEKPVPPEPWSGVRNATQIGPGCHPGRVDRQSLHTLSQLYGDGTTVNTNWSEDCLSLNIVAPLAQEGSLLPVAVFIHGGFYSGGTAADYLHDVDGLIRRYTSKGIVLVFAQYRLGFLGFASTNETGFGANFGLWDHLAALQFVNMEIHRFGGDPSRITIWGQSAGAASVSSLAYSRRSIGLFSQAIQMSGQMVTVWCNGSYTVDSTWRWGRKAGCPGGTSEELKNCLKGRKSLSELEAAFNRLSEETAEGPATFLPFPDKDFYGFDEPHNANTWIDESLPKRATMIGLDSREALMMVLINGISSAIAEPAPSCLLTLAPSEWTKFNRRNFEKVVSACVVPAERWQLAQQIVDFYLMGRNRSTVGADKHFYLERDVQLHSDIIAFPLLEEAARKAAHGWPVYLYVIDHQPAEAKWHLPIKGAFHGMEIDFLFKHGQQLSEQDAAFESVLVDAVVNFIRDGNPSTGQFNWLPVLAQSPPFRYARLNEGATLQFELWPEMYKFWQKMTR